MVVASGASANTRQYVVLLFCIEGSDSGTPILYISATVNLKYVDVILTFETPTIQNPLRSQQAAISFSFVFRTMTISVWCRSQLHLLEVGIDSRHGRILLLWLLGVVEDQ